MTTYADICLKAELIGNLAKKFGYDDEVKIVYYLPEDEGDEIKLCFIVKSRNPDEQVPRDNHGLLEAKLSAELGCEVDVKDYRYIPTLDQYDTDRRCALITDQKAVKEVVYRINNRIYPDVALSEEDLAAVDDIKLEDIKCRNVPEYDKWLQEGLLRQADQYLKKNIDVQQSTPSIAAEQAYSIVGIVGDQKKRKSPEKAIESGGEEKPKLEVKKQGDNLFVALIIPIPKDSNYDEREMVNTEIADELAKQYFAKISHSTPSPTKNS